MSWGVSKLTADANWRFNDSGSWYIRRTCPLCSHLFLHVLREVYLCSWYVSYQILIHDVDSGFGVSSTNSFYVLIYFVYIMVFLGIFWYLLVSSPFTSLTVFCVWCVRLVRFSVWRRERINKMAVWVTKVTRGVTPYSDVSLTKAVVVCPANTGL